MLCLVTYVTYQTGYVVAIHTTQESQEGTEVQRTNIIFSAFHIQMSEH